MPSLSFDPVAHAYDATRGYPVAVAEQISEAIANQAHATSETRFLEVGVGTGRIAFPLASKGHLYTGVDISEKMLEQLELKLIEEDGWQERQEPWGAMPDEKTASPVRLRRFNKLQQQAMMRLVMADMTSLPFYDAVFDVAVAVHVFHLVDGWQQAVSEVLRVLRPGGLFLHCWDEYVDAVKWPVESTWQQIITDLGGTIKRPGSSTRSDITGWLQEHALHPQEVCVMHWKTTLTPRQAVESVTKRLWSSTWVVPDDLFAASVERLEQWANSYFAAEMDTPRELDRQFVISKTQV